MLTVLFAGQIECYNLSSQVCSNYESMFANPVGISVFERRIFVSDSARETISSVDVDLSSERLMERNVEEPSVLTVYTRSLNGKPRGIFITKKIFITFGG